MRPPTVKVHLLDPMARLQKRQTPGSSGLDLYSVEEKVVAPREWRPVKTGIALEIPRGFEGQVRPRSGLAAKFGVTVLNSPGTIDSDYRGEVVVLLVNHGYEDFHVHKGDRIAQLVISPVEHCVVMAQYDVLSETSRGSGGFGSTGIAADEDPPTKDIKIRKDGSYRYGRGRPQEDDEES